MYQLIKPIFLLLIFLSFTTISNAQKTEISPKRKAAIDSLALEKVKDLGKYISIIGNKNTAPQEAYRVIERAEELFAPDSEMGVSSLNSDKVKNYSVKDYFQRLMALNYDRVKIEWYNIRYISDLERQPDGKFIGVITIFQRFEGQSSDGSAYVDTTKKDITIYVDRKETQIGGKKIGFWDVLLGDIRVTETTN